MPAGCEFYCDNKECSNFKTGFVITAPWPMGRIGTVLQSSALRERPHLKDEFLSLKKQGKKFVCIVYPNIDNIETEFYRVQMWSDAAKCIWEYNVPPLNEIDIESYEENDIVEKICPTTKCKLRGFIDVITNGIKCPKCNKDLFQSRWYSK